MVDLREPEHYGNVLLSVQASKSHYCSPRVDGLPIDEYESVEIALLDEGNHRFLYPEDLLSADMAALFEPPYKVTSVRVAGYVSQADLRRIRLQLEHG